jgi:hypothetical protein
MKTQAANKSSSQSLQITFGGDKNKQGTNNVEFRSMHPDHHSTLLVPCLPAVGRFNICINLTSQPPLYFTSGSSLFFTFFPSRYFFTP